MINSAPRAIERQKEQPQPKDLLIEPSDTFSEVIEAINNNKSLDIKKSETNAKLFKDFEEECNADEVNITPYKNNMQEKLQTIMKSKLTTTSSLILEETFIMKDEKEQLCQVKNFVDTLELCKKTYEIYQLNFNETIQPTKDLHDCLKILSDDPTHGQKIKAIQALLTPPDPNLPHEAEASASLQTRSRGRALTRKN